MNIRKKIRNAVLTAAAATATALMSACSGNDAATAQEKLERYADADAPVLVVADLGAVPEDAPVPYWFCRATGLTAADAGAIFHNDYLERNTMMLKAAFTENEEATGFVVLSVSDARRFVESVAEDKNEEVVNVADYVCVDRSGFPVAANGRMAYVGFGSGAGDGAADLITAIERAESEAVSRPLPRWQMERLGKKALVAASVTADVAQKILQGSPAEAYLPALPSGSRLVAQLQEKGQKATLHAEALSRSGQPVALLPQKGSAGFDVSLVRFAAASDVFLAGAGRIEDLTQTLPEESFLTSVAETLGTQGVTSVMVSAGPDPQNVTAALLNPTTHSWHWVVALKMEKGKAQKALNTLAGYMQFTGMMKDYVPSEMLALAVPVPSSRMFDDDVDVPVTLTVEGDVLVAQGGATPAEGKCTLDVSVLKGKQLGAVAYLKGADMRQLNLDCDLAADAVIEGNALTVTLNVKNSDRTVRDVIGSIMGADAK